MATEFLLPNGNDGGWDVSDHTNINNGIDSGTPNDSTLVSETTEGIVLDLDLDDSAITDADTVTEVEVRIRARNNGGGGSDRCLIDWMIGGVAQGTQFDTGNLTTGFLTYVAVGSVRGWDVDWTAAQLDGAQVRLTSSQAGKSVALALEVSEVEVEVTYTEAAADSLQSQVWM